MKLSSSHPPRDDRPIRLKGAKAGALGARGGALLATARASCKTVSALEISVDWFMRPQYRLRVDEVRVFYDVSGATVAVLAIAPKTEAELWLAQFGSPE